MLKKTFLLLCFLSITTITANADENECVDCLARMCAKLQYDYGYSLRTAASEKLAEGAEMIYTITLYRQVAYAFVGCGDSYCNDLDLYLYDENGNLVDRDRATDKSPIVQVVPSSTGTFYLKVKMYDTYQNNPSWFGVAVMFKE